MNRFSSATSTRSECCCFRLFKLPSIRSLNTSAAAISLTAPLVSSSVIRTPVRDVRIAGRKTQGVTVLRVDEGDRVVSVTCIADTEAAAAGANGHGSNGTGTNGDSNDAGATGGEEA